MRCNLALGLNANTAYFCSDFECSESGYFSCETKIKKIKKSLREKEIDCLPLANEATLRQLQVTEDCLLILINQALVSLTVLTVIRLST